MRRAPAASYFSTREPLPGGDACSHPVHTQVIATLKTDAVSDVKKKNAEEVLGPITDECAEHRAEGRVFGGVALSSSQGLAW